MPEDIPEHEAWLYKNPVALALVQKGIAEAAAGNVGTVQDFSQYADLEIDDEEESYAPSPPGSHVMTQEQAEEFERRQAEPPREPTEAEREAVRVFRATVRRS